MTSTSDIKVGYLCNNHCLHCAIGDSSIDWWRDHASKRLCTIDQQGDLSL